MVNVVSAAQAAIDAWSAIVRLLAVPDSNVTAIAAMIAPIYLPTYQSITLGHYTPLNQSAVRDGAAAQFQHSRDIGLGTDVKLLYSRIEPVSNESAICWLTLYLCPPEKSNIECYSYTEPFGFRLNDTINNGLGGGWEWGIGDQEFQGACARAPSFSDRC